MIVVRAKWLHATLIEPSKKETYMSPWQKTCITLIAALFAGLTGMTLAAAAGSPESSAPAVTPYQKQETPPDCKRNPEDPRCKKKPY